MSTAKAKSVDVYSIDAEKASRLSALLRLSAEVGKDGLRTEAGAWPDCLGGWV